MEAATIVHLSDLHLGENPDDEGKPTRGSLKAWFSSATMEMQSHDPYILTALHVEMRSAARSVGASDDFDFYVVTGDISTNATSSKRFLFARDYLTSKVAFGSFFSVGLSFDAKRLFCVPGNHDKMFERTPERYLHGLGNLPAAPPYHVAAKAKNGREFHILGIDSNDYREGNIAKGKIAPDTFGWLANELSQLPAEEPRHSVRILLLHHHPADLNRFKRQSLLACLSARFTTLDEGLRLLALCDGKVDVIMHGHEHLPAVFREPPFSPLIVSAGTTAEWSPRGRQENSFFTLTFDGSEVRVRKFAWNGSAFVFQRKWDEAIYSKYPIST